MDRSPFPGLDPYLERHWGDVQTSLVVYARDALNEGFAGMELVARCDERWIMDEAEGTNTSVARLRERYVNVIDTLAGGRVITSIEFLSPRDKLPGPGRLQYALKQQQCADAGASLVEVDLVRQGEWRVAMLRERLRQEWGDGQVTCVRRGWMLSQFEMYVMPLRQRLPAVRVPLRRDDPDAVLDLQSLLDRAYRAGAYGWTLDYRGDPFPQLGADDAAWADALLRAAGKR